MGILLSNPNLRVGSRGPEVGNLQRFLNEALSADLDDDEVFGKLTRAALLTYQEGVGIDATGELDTQTRTVAQPEGFIPFVQAVSCQQWFPKREAKNAITIHTIECVESNLLAAETNALWMAGKTAYPAPQASAHYFIDADSVVQTVRDGDRAWHAKQVNPRAYGLEHAGFAKQSAGDWADAISQAILERSARIAAKLCRRDGIAVRWLSTEQIKAGASGFMGHADVTNAYDAGKGHWDPGTEFPREAYLARVRALVG